MKNVIVFGKGTLAIRIADWFCAHGEYDLVRVVPVVPEPDWTDSLMEWARRRGVPCVETGRYDAIPGAELESWSIDLGVSVFYDRIFKKWFIEKCKRLINVHNGPLPRYRGVSPINWALKNGETSHGVTIHEITPGVDDGPIIAQLCYSIYPDVDEVIDVYSRALEYGWTLFHLTMPILDRIVPVPQDESKATYYGVAQNVYLGDRGSFTRALSLSEGEKGPHSPA